MSTRDRENIPFVVTFATMPASALARFWPVQSSIRPAPGRIPIRLAPMAGRSRAKRNSANALPMASPIFPERIARIYAGVRTLVMGGGHSAANALLDLAVVAEDEPGTTMTWAVRGNSLAKVFGGRERPISFPARGELGDRLRHARRPKNASTLKCRSRLSALKKNGNGVLVEGLTPGGVRTHRSLRPHRRRNRPAPGFLPSPANCSSTFIPVVESTRRFGPLIDPNEHSCGIGSAAWLARACAYRAWTTSSPASRAMAARRPSCCSPAMSRFARSPRISPAITRPPMMCALCLPETGMCNATLKKWRPAVKLPVAMAPSQTPPNRAANARLPSRIQRVAAARRSQRGKARKKLFRHDDRRFANRRTLNSLAACWRNSFFATRGLGCSLLRIRSDHRLRWERRRDGAEPR